MDDASLDRLVPMVSHELNSALTTVLGNAHLLRERGESLPPEARLEALADLLENAERLFSAVQNLLLLAKLEMGEQPYCQPVLLPRLVADLLAVERRRRPDRVIRLRFRRARSPVALASRCRSWKQRTAAPPERDGDGRGC